MQRLDLDFRSHRAASPWASRVLLAAALAFSVDTAMSYRDLRGSIDASSAKLARPQARDSTPARKPSPEEVMAVRETVDRLGMPWDQLFRALESAASDQVALLGIEPDPKAGTVLISGDGSNYLAALTYVLNLSKADTLTRVQLVRHEAKTDNPQGPVSFSVSAAWSSGKP